MMLPQAMASAVPVNTNNLNIPTPNNKIEFSEDENLNTIEISTH